MGTALNLLKDRQSDLFSRTAEILAVIAAPVRIRIAHFLSQAPLTVEVLAEKIDQSTANTSMHLRKMLSQGVVSVEVIGQKRLYSLHPAMFAFWESCQDFIQSIDPSIKMLSEQEDEELNWGLTPEETPQEDVIYLDVRPSDEVQESNRPKVKNYLHIPQSELKKKLGELPKRKKFLVLCRGRMCALSIYAVNYLRENNVKAYRVDKSWFALQREST